MAPCRADARPDLVSGLWRARPQGDERPLSEDEQLGLVKASVRVLKPRVSYDVRQVDVVPLASIAFFEAEPGGESHPSERIRCIVHKAEVLCTAGEILSKAAAAERLGSKPDTLSDDDWASLCAWAIEPDVFSAPYTARGLGEAPKATERIGEVQVERIPLSGVRVTLHFVFGEEPTYPDVPTGLRRVEVRVNHDDTVQLTEQTFWKPE